MTDNHKITYPIYHDPSGISRDGVPDAVVGVSLIMDLPVSRILTVRALAWAMRPSQLRFELLALRTGSGLVHQGLIWAGVGYENVVDDCSLNGEQAAEDNLVSHLMQNSREIVGIEQDERTWRALVKALSRVGLHQHPYGSMGITYGKI